MQIHVSRNGQNYGPYTPDEVRQYLQSGHILPNDLAWHEGLANWEPVNRLAILSGPAPRPAAPAAHDGAATQVMTPDMLRGAQAAAVRTASVASAPVLGAGALGVASTTDYAGFWKRFVAIIIDSIIVAIPAFIVGAILGVAFQNAPEAGAIINVLVGLAIGWAYYALQESSPAQATLGKRALGIIVVDYGGRRISLARATGRFFGKYLSGLILLIGYLMAAFTPRKQALHDFLAGTLVVNRR